MILKRESLLIVIKIVGTIALLIAILVWTFFMIVIVPLIMILVYHGTKGKVSNFRTSLAMIPVGVFALLIFRLWSKRRFDYSLDRVEDHFGNVLAKGMKRIKS